MSSVQVQVLREFINQRLTAAAAEIFTVFEQTVLQYEEELDRQRQLLEISWKPQIKLHRTNLQQQHDCREEQLFKQETDCLEQEEPEPPLIQEEPEEPEPPLIQEEPEPPLIQEEPEEPEPPLILEEPEEPEPPQVQEKPEEPGLLQFNENQEEPDPPQTEELGTNQEGEQLRLKVESDLFRVSSIEAQSYLNGPEEEPDTHDIISHNSEVQDVKQHLENFPESENRTEREETCGEISFGLNLGTVAGKRKLICEICGESYIRQSQFLAHRRTHERLDSVSIRGKHYAQPGHFLDCIQTNTGERSYSCGTCGRSFVKNSNLSRHIRIHTGERPYSCQMCGKRFTRQSHLLRHLRTHTGQKPYSCPSCGMRFANHASLLRHMKNHYEVKS